MKQDLPQNRPAERPQTVPLGSIQALRAYAAIGVVIGHALLEADANFGLERSHYRWTAGTHLFFVISGFIMAYTNADAFGLKGAAGHFMVRRLRRIVPLYWLFTTLVLATLLAGHALRTTTLEWNNVIGSYLFWPVARPDGLPHPLLSVGWTLNYEMFFYVLFAACLLLRRDRALLLLTAIMALLALLSLWVPATWTAVTFWCDPVILEFLAGVFLGYLLAVRGKQIANRAAGFAILALGFAGLFMLPNIPVELGSFHRLLVYGVPSVVIVGAAAFLVPAHLDRRIPRIILLLGDSSYALYLSHRFSLRLISDGGQRFGLADPNLHLLLAVGGCVIVGVLVHLWIEKPLLRFLQHRARPVVEVAP